MEKTIRVRFYMRNGAVIDDNSMIFEDDASENDVADAVGIIKDAIRKAVGQNRDGYLCLGHTYASAKDILAVQLSGSVFDMTDNV